MVGIAGGAEYILIPEIETDPEQVAKTLGLAYEHGKTHALIVVAEGAEIQRRGVNGFFEKHEDRLGGTKSATILGHVKRRTPGAFDRNLASRLGHGAMKRLTVKNTVSGRLNQSKITTIPRRNCWKLSQFLWNGGACSYSRLGYQSTLRK